jgi:hypothetical protein
MSARVDPPVIIWKYPFHFLYLLIRAHVCGTHACPSLLDNKSALGHMAELIHESGRFGALKSDSTHHLAATEVN